MWPLSVFHNVKESRHMRSSSSFRGLFQLTMFSDFFTHSALFILLSGIKLSTMSDDKSQNVSSSSSLGFRSSFYALEQERFTLKRYKDGSEDMDHDAINEYLEAKVFL